MAGAPTAPAVDPTSTTRPHRAVIMSGAASRVSSNAASRFTASVARHAWGVSAQMGWPRYPPRAAACTTMVTGPSRRAWLTASAHPPGWSKNTGTAVTPGAWAATSASRAGDRPAAATAAPRPARATAVARPMPLLPPVTRATRPARSPRPASPGMHNAPQRGHHRGRITGPPRVPAERHTGGTRRHRLAASREEILAVVHPRSAGDQHRHAEARRLPESAGRLRERGLDHVRAKLRADLAGGRDVQRFIPRFPGRFRFGWHDLTHVRAPGRITGRRDPGRVAEGAELERRAQLDVREHRVHPQPAGVVQG